MKNSSGFTLLEVLVSMMLLALALFTFNGVQLMILQKQRQLLYLYIADLQLHALLEIFAVNTESLSQENISRWKNQVSSVLPKGKGILSYDANHAKAIILWGERKSDDCMNTEIGLKGCLTKILY